MTYLGTLDVGGPYPLRTWSTTVDTFVILVGLGDLEQLAPSLRIDFPHLAHLDGIVVVIRMGWRNGLSRGVSGISLSRYIMLAFDGIALKLEM